MSENIFNRCENL